MVVCRRQRHDRRRRRRSTRIRTATHRIESAAREEVVHQQKSVVPSEALHVLREERSIHANVLAATCCVPRFFS